MTLSGGTLWAFVLVLHCESVPDARWFKGGPQNYYIQTKMYRLYRKKTISVSKRRCIYLDRKIIICSCFFLCIVYIFWSFFKIIHTLLFGYNTVVQLTWYLPFCVTYTTSKHVSHKNYSESILNFFRIYKWI